MRDDKVDCGSQMMQTQPKYTQRPQSTMKNEFNLIQFYSFFSWLSPDIILLHAGTLHEFLSYICCHRGIYHV